MSDASGYDDLTDQDLMNLAKRIVATPLGSRPHPVRWVMKWGAYESVIRELRLRMLRHAMRQLNEQLGLPDIGL